MQKVLLMLLCGISAYGFQQSSNQSVSYSGPGGVTITNTSVLVQKVENGHIRTYCFSPQPSEKVTLQVDLPALIYKRLFEEAKKRGMSLSDLISEKLHEVDEKQNEVKSFYSPV